MSFDERETLMMFLLRHSGVFAEARLILVPEHFEQSYEIIWAVAWRSCLDLFNQYGSLPAREVLESDSLSRLTQDTDIPESAIQELRSFIAWAFDVESEVLWRTDSESYAMDLLQKFLKERHWIDPMRRLMQAIGDATPADVPSILQDLQNRHSQVTAVTVQRTEALIPERWDEENQQKVSTDLEFIDLPMGGGTLDGEVYGLLGTFGSGKTSMACGIAGKAAMRFAHEAANTNRPPRCVFFYTYETPPNDIRHKVISHLAQIDINHLKRYPYERTLSRIGRRHEYEASILAASDERGEWERLQAVLPIQNIFRIADMRGSPESPRTGAGYIDEIYSDLDKNRRRYGYTPGAVFIDYAQVCCRRHIRANGWDEDRKLRHLLNGFGDECRRMIASHFGCTVWIISQLSGQANKRGAGARLTHADSAEATSFAENLWYAFCIGNKDRATGTVVFDASKTRNSEGTPRPSILHVNGRFCRFDPVDDRYMLHPHTSRIVARSVGRTIVDPDSEGGEEAPPSPPSSAHRGFRPGF